MKKSLTWAEQASETEQMLRMIIREESRSTQPTPTPREVESHDEDLAAAIALSFRDDTGTARGVEDEEDTAAAIALSLASDGPVQNRSGDADGMDIDG